MQVYPRDDVHVVVVGGEANAMMQGWQMWGATTVSIDKWLDARPKAGHDGRERL